MKVKVGDKIKIKTMDSDVVEAVKVGDIGIVEEIMPTMKYPIWVQFRDCCSSYGFKEFELEVIIN